MRNGEMKTLATETLEVMEGVSVERGFKKYSARNSEIGGVYYGGNFHDAESLKNNSPDYQLDKGGSRATIRYGNASFFVWVLSLEALTEMVKGKSKGIIDWSFFNHAPLADGVTLVFPSNRWELEEHFTESQSCSSLNGESSDNGPWW